MGLRFQKSMIATILVLMTGSVVVTIGQACGSSHSENSATSASSSASGAALGAPEMKIIPNTRTASTVYANQVLENFVSCTGLETTTTRMREIWGQRKGSISEEGKALAVTGPMLISLVSLSAEVCRELISKEMAAAATDRRIFNGVDLAVGRPAMGSVQFSSSLSRLAKACWQRDVTESERAAILDPMGSVVDDPAGRRVANVDQVNEARALFMCTAVLASLRSIEI